MVLLPYCRDINRKELLILMSEKEQSLPLVVCDPQKGIEELWIIYENLQCIGSDSVLYTLYTLGEITSPSKLQLLFIKVNVCLRNHQTKQDVLTS